MTIAQVQFGQEYNLSRTIVPRHGLTRRTVDQAFPIEE
eukprot:SAG31_NODE_438_length_15693_cov_6.254248_2_plen_38_part_00